MYQCTHLLPAHSPKDTKHPSPDPAAAGYHHRVARAPPRPSPSASSPISPPSAAPSPPARPVCRLQHQPYRDRPCFVLRVNISGRRLQAPTWSIQVCHHAYYQINQDLRTSAYVPGYRTSPRHRGQGPCFPSSEMLAPCFTDWKHADGLFKLTLQFTEDYPAKQPSVLTD